MSDYFKCEDIPIYRGSQHHADFGTWKKITHEVSVDDLIEEKINKNRVSGRP